MNQSEKKHHPLHIIGVCFCYLLFTILIGLLVLFALMRFQNRIALVFGQGIARVATGSMEPTLHVGDYIGILKVDPASLEVGDIIVVYSAEDLEQSGKTTIVPVTHRLVEINHAEDGSLLFLTRGDANPVPDKPRPESDLIGLCTGKLPFLSSVGDLMSDPWIFFAAVLLPAFVFFITELINVAKKRAAIELLREQMQITEKESNRNGKENP